jgi:hypothetical protein
MAKYWETRPRPHTTTSAAPSPLTPRSGLNGYDQHRRMLLARGEEGWVAELGRYLGDLPHDATADMDVVKYWQVRTLMSLSPQF